MADFEHTLHMLKFFIKKEIIDNYFAERTYLEEDLELLQRKEKEYEAELDRALPVFAAFYHLLGSEAAIAAVLKLWGAQTRPGFPEYQQVSPAARQAVLEKFPPHGWTARGRLKNQIFDLYKQVHKTAQDLRKKQLQVAAHCELYNEDVEKFNRNYDFNLIAAQVEALEGHETPLESGLSATDREAMSARMLLHKKVPKACILVTMPELPPLDAIKKKLGRIIDQ
ncbi:MAG: hypothetical protein FJ135_00870 [Deltaproteobacteria bacterium]|nr:hypothetical protein [Deltaproteobacteria bacterium]